MYQIKGTEYLITEGEELYNGGFNKIFECAVVDNEGQVIKDNLVLKRPINEIDFHQASRLEREMRYIEMLEHDNILKPFHCDFDEGFIVMEKLPMNLHDFIVTTSYSKEEYMDIFSDILSGVDYYLSQGILHRDLKTKNILMDSNKKSKITDFGLSSRKVREETVHQLTRIGNVGGTEFFSAPEQLRNLMDSDVRSEIYSLGKILYVLATRDVTYHSINFPNNMDIQLKHIISTATKYDPDERYQTIEDFIKSFNLVHKPSEIINIKSFKIDVLVNALTKELLQNQPSREVLQQYMQIILDPNYKDNVELMVALEVSTHRAMWNYDSPNYSIFIQNTCDNISTQGFIFSFVDSITSSTIAILENLKEVMDIDLQAQIINATVKVAVKHNRFWAMQKIAEYIGKITNELLLVSLNTGKFSLDKDEISTLSIYHDSPELRRILDS